MKSDRENREWLDEYPSLKQVIPDNPFTVPDGYFDGLEEQIESCVRVSELVPPSSQPFAVPDNYFEDLNNNILSRINIEEALKADKRSFAVPKNYFEDMQQQINSRIVIDEALKHPFTVPDDYFENMHAQVNSRIAIDEALQTPFTVPDNYFNDLSRNILNQTAGLEAIKRKGLIRKLVTSAAFKYASAACFALIVGAGIFITQVNSPKAEHERSYLHKALSQVPDNEIEGYLQLHIDASAPKTAIDETDQSNLNTISADDLSDYLSNN